MEGYVGQSLFTGLSYWFQTRWFLCEFPIGSYVKLSTAVQPSWSEGNSHWMVLFQNGVRQLRSPAKMATTVQLRCYWKQLWSSWAITGSWVPLVIQTQTFYSCIVLCLLLSSLCRHNGFFEIIKKHIHVSQMKNKLPVQITETLIFVLRASCWKKTKLQYPKSIPTFIQCQWLLCSKFGMIRWLQLKLSHRNHSVNRRTSTMMTAP
jgi:hypothetical protein